MSFKEFIVEKLQKTNIFEMAYSRQKYMDILDGLKRQILENWILIRFCTLSGRTENKEHWKDELDAHIINLYDMTLKVNNKKNASKEVLIDMAEYDNEDRIIKTIYGKCKKEQIDIKDENIIQACKDWVKYGIHEIIDIISMNITNDNYDYIEEYIYEKI